MYLGYGSQRTLARAAGRRPALRRPAARARGRPARRAAAVGRVGRRGRDGDPALDPQPPAARRRTSCSSASRPACRSWSATSPRCTRSSSTIRSGPSARSAGPTTRPTSPGHRVDRRACREAEQAALRARCLAGGPRAAGTGRPSRRPARACMPASGQRRERPAGDRPPALRPRPALDGRVRFPDVPDCQHAERPGPRRSRCWPGWRRACPPVRSTRGLPDPARPGLGGGRAARPAPRAGRGWSAAHGRSVVEPAGARTGSADSRRSPAGTRAATAGRRTRPARGDRPDRPRRSAGRRARPRRRADLVHAMAYMGIPSAWTSAAGTARRSSTTPATSTSTPRTSPACRGPARRLFARIERGWARRASRVITVNVPYAEVMAERFGVPMPLIVLNCAYRRRTPEPRPRRFHERLGLAASTRVVLYQGGFSRDRGIEQLIARPAGAARRRPGPARLRPAPGRARGRGRDPGLAGRLHVLPAVAADRADRLGRLGRRRGHADPADHPEPSPDHAQQAVRGDGGGRPGRRQRPARDGRRSSARPAAASWSIRPIPRRSPARSAACWPVPGCPRGDRPARATRPILPGTTGRPRSKVLLAEYGRLTGRPW